MQLFHVVLVTLGFLLAVDFVGSAGRGEGRAGAPGAALHQAEAEPPRWVDPEHRLWTEVLGRHVRGDRLDYRALREDRGDLGRYLASLRAVMPEEFAGWPRDAQMAFWINAYNAHAVDLVLGEYPVDSIKDIGSLLKPVWKKRFIPLGHLAPDLGREELSLDDVEHEILRPRFRDARVHAAVNCASLSCPALRAEAYVGERLDEQLDQQVHRWLADPTLNRFEREKRRARISEIFRWFEEDFVREAPSVPAWIAGHGPEDLVGWLDDAGKVEVGYLDYSWKLNDVPR